MVRGNRHWIGMWLVACGLSIILCCSMLLVPATAFAAAARSHSRSSCGESSNAHISMTTTLGADIWLNHSSGPMNTPLIINGGGWPADTPITIDAYGDDSSGHLVLGQRALVQVMTHADGTFQTTPFLAPIDQTCGMGANYGYAGQFVSFFAHTHDNRVSAQVTFDYVDVFLSSPQTNDTSVPPGTTISVSGYTWIAGEHVTLTTALTEGPTQEALENASVTEPSGEPALHLTANAKGSFTAEVVIPKTLIPPAGFVVGATGFDSAYGTITATPLVFLVLPSAAPTFTASSARGYPGTVVTLHGANWLPGSVAAEYCRGQTSGNPVSLYSPDVIADLSCNPLLSEGLGFTLVHGGVFSMKITLPPNARPGPITIQVSAQSDIAPEVYVQAVPFTVLATWQVIHPRLAEVLHVGQVAVPVLLVVSAISVVVVLWQRRRRSRARQAW